MKIFNQQDYPNDYLGDTKYSIARWGCLDTVITMIYDYLFSRQLNPVEISKLLSFNSDGELEWWSLKNIGLKLDERVRFYSKEKIDDAYASDDKFIALQVNNSHWVWVIGRYYPYFGYKIVDPLHGDKARSTRYANITGHAIISKIDEEVCNQCCPVHCK